MSGSREPLRGDIPPPLSPLGTLVRLGVIGAVLLVAAGAFAYTGGWLSPDRLTPDRIIDAFEHDNGVHPGFRRNHAKGLCIAGSFESNGQGVRLSKAAVFAPGRVPVVGRFANADGHPFVVDTPASIRSMALQFTTSNGEVWRTGINDIPVFVVKTPQAFYDLLVASAPDPATQQPDPAKMQAFFAAHPEMLKAIGAIKAQPFSSGFGDAAYNSLNAFRFVNAAGTSTPVRWSMVPVQPVTAESPDQAAQTDKNYLFDDLIAQVRKGPLQWRLVVTVGQPGDVTDDATVAWPADREQVDVGTMTIDHVEAEAAGNCRDINFDPLVLPSGIEASDDPLLSARSAAYSKSYTRRSGEPKSPSAVQTDAAQGSGS
ncbi:MULTISPECIES: catalase family peroxidase [Inquilinus]|uniref:Catalase-related peroxidase n=1 Tax=Inquilinus ginsengisoli TaxID=363840 RepID=A0ABU1JU89_9PROT|nr:catalase family peroxidase [Inquilinus ginsengisoli]MDR6291150.1 catalase [Inquilinus ginsengisoli]